MREGGCEHQVFVGSQVNLDRDTGALVDGSAVETLYLSDNFPVLEGAFNANGIEVNT